MIIHDLDILGSGCGPPEYDAPLIVDPDCVFACEIAFESFKLISRWRRQVLQNTGVVQLNQFPPSDLGERVRKAFRDFAVSKDRPCELAFEAPDHLALCIMMRYVPSSSKYHPHCVADNLAVFNSRSAI